LAMSATCCSVQMCGSPDCLQLTEREAQVCMTICASSEPVAFSALRSKLGYHQEVVSRILKRLVNHGAIEKVRGRYRRVSQ
jgi:DNA-binding MarR family transcriptional regulator